MIITLIAVFIIAGTPAMSGATGTPFNPMAARPTDALNRNAGTF